MNIKQISIKKSFGQYNNISMVADLEENEKIINAVRELDDKIDLAIRTISWIDIKDKDTRKKAWVIAMTNAGIDHELIENYLNPNDSDLPF